MGKRPDRALIRYSSKLRELYPHATIIIGGIEASLRRLNHYDYWDNSVRRSILLDSKADLLLYGMGEKTIVQVADALDSGLAVQDLIYLRNTVWKTKDQTLLPSHHVLLPSYDAVLADKKLCSVVSNSISEYRCFYRTSFGGALPKLLCRSKSAGISAFYRRNGCHLCASLHAPMPPAHRTTRSCPGD